MCGLLLTYSRASIFSFIIVLSFIIFSKLIKIFQYKKLDHRSLISFGVILTFAFFSIFLMYDLFPTTISFFSENFFSYYDFSNPEASEGYRIYMASEIGRFIFYNPLTGSGFLGVWILFSDFSGSAHGQYFDVLFRVGIIGLFLYIVTLCRLINFMKLRDPSLFWGFLGIIIYGFFHETFKLSNGAFILAFLLGTLDQDSPNSIKCKI